MKCMSAIPGRWSTCQVAMKLATDVAHAGLHELNLMSGSPLLSHCAATV